MKPGAFLTAVLASVPWAAIAQPPAIEVSELACLPNEDNAKITARVTPELGGSSVRLYFRRLHPEGDFYFDQLFAEGDGSYWTVFPKPEDRDPSRLTDSWWKELDGRDWLAGRDREWLAEWLEASEHEAAEYYVAVHDAQGRQLAQSPVRLVEVRDADDCPATLAARERGWAQNLTIGETTAEQRGRQVFHWLCDGIVTRIGADGVLRGDEFCRACVVAALPPWVLPTAGAVAANVIASEVIEDDDQPPASPARP